MENKRTDLINNSDIKDKNAGTSRQLFVIKIIMIVFFLTGVVGIIVSQIVLPREGDDSVFFCDKFEPQWTQVMEDGTKKAVDVSERLDGEYGSEFVIETKVTARLAAYGYLCVKSMRQDVKIFVENKHPTLPRTPDFTAIQVRATMFLQSSAHRTRARF